MNNKQKSPSNSNNKIELKNSKLNNTGKILRYSFKKDFTNNKSTENKYFRKF